MSFEEFQDGRHGGHLGYQNGTILAILTLCVTVMLPIKFWLNPTFAWEEMNFEEFQDGHHGMVAILDIGTEQSCSMARNHLNKLAIPFRQKAPCEIW